MAGILFDCLQIKFFKMKINSLCSICIILLLASCSGYQFVALDSPLPRDQQNAFTWENDSLKIVYRFAGANGPIKLTIFNKLKEAISVDWKSSAVVINGQSRSLFKNIQTVDLIEGGSQHEIVDGVTWDRSRTNGTIQNENNSDIIIGKTFIENNKGFLVEMRTKLPESTTKVESVLNGNLPVKKYLYKEENSPFKVDIYLSFQIENSAKTFYISNKFWVNEMIKSGAQLSYYLPGENRFYID